jgi:hypothetical protein
VAYVEANIGSSLWRRQFASDRGGAERIAQLATSEPVAASVGLRRLDHSRSCE